VERKIAGVRKDPGWPTISSQSSIRLDVLPQLALLQVESQLLAHVSPQLESHVTVQLPLPQVVPHSATGPPGFT
jgi:hypothetical protein